MAINIRRNVPRRHADKFVGRADEQNLFLADCADLLKGNDSYCINFYGAGGVGKTALINQLMKSLDRLKSFKSEYKDVYILYHDFANGINMREILRQWKGELEKFGCEFPYFETSDFYLFLKEGVKDIDKPLMKSWLNRAKDNLEKLTGFSNSTVPVVVAFTTIADISVEALGVIPGINSVNALVKLLNQYLAANKTNEQLGKNKNLLDELERRAGLRNPHELEEYLPTLFAQDIFDWAGGDKKFVVFLDGCELIGGNKLGADNLPLDWWLAGEYGLISQMPATLWVAASRNKLTWADGIEQRHLNLLPESEAEELLKRLSVEENLRGEIIKLAAGYPLFLVELARRRSQLNDETISEIREEILERILRDLSPTEKTLLQNFSRLNSWTDAEARAIPNFNPHGYRKLKELSFVQSDDAGKFFLEPALQKILS